jgi:Protein of unknown function (DUF3277)
MATYSFVDTNCILAGPGGVVSMGNGAGAAAEGITFTHTEEKDTVITGADGTIMHSLHASMTGRIIIRLLKTSPTNGILSILYNFQRTGGAAYWGQNTIALSNATLGDIIGGSQMAFVKHPDVVYATEGNVNDWEFSGYIVPELGPGIPGLTPAP